MTAEKHIAMLKVEAMGLLEGGDPPGTNPEYERGLCELIARFGQALGSGEFTDKAARTIAKEIGANWPAGEVREES